MTTQRPATRQEWVNALNAHYCNAHFLAAEEYFLNNPRDAQRGQDGIKHCVYCKEAGLPFELPDFISGVKHDATEDHATARWKSTIEHLHAAREATARRNLSLPEPLDGWLQLVLSDGDRIEGKFHFTNKFFIDAYGPEELEQDTARMANFIRAELAASEASELEAILPPIEDDAPPAARRRPRH
ncbi:hypothetical protein [Cupriavidus metallidurans]|uniref:hypothetical protein n=1 Tax=Cupriavidus metallidurans TaxID=119219 RepID=UPI000CE056C9|nr:hypothetical protein [Cupriavidus metallidurans]AVA36284.1 hypothetical protein C3Z06_23510 [Cupriavidus metallidurans]